MLFGNAVQGRVFWGFGETQRGGRWGLEKGMLGRVIKIDRKKLYSKNHESGEENKLFIQGLTLWPNLGISSEPLELISIGLEKLFAYVYLNI